MSEPRYHSTAKSRSNPNVSRGLGQVEQYNEVGLEQMRKGRYLQSLKYFALAITKNSKTPCFHYNKGLAHKALGHVQSAEQALTSALKLDPNYAKAHFSLGDLLLSVRDFGRAESHLRKAISINPGYVAAYNHLALCFADQGRLREAQELLQHALQIDPHSAHTRCNLGNMARLSSHFNEAILHYQEAIRLQPQFIEAHFNLSVVLLLIQDFGRGWTEYEWRLRFFEADSGYPNRHGLPLWEQQPLKGKAILVYDEQGFADVFMASRYLLALKSQGAQVVFETRPELFDLFNPMPYIDETTLRHLNRPPSIQCDYCVPLLSLPGRFKVTYQTIQFDAPYLFADAYRVKQWSQKITGDGLKIGLVWHGSAADQTCHLDIKLLRKLGVVPGVRWYGLQKGPLSTSGDNTVWMVQLGTDLKDFADTAAAIANLDLVITIDTAVAHLAGAMGKPVWVLLPHVPDWRWFLYDTKTPWYPSMKLFRQPAPGDWESPLSSIFEELQKWISYRNQSAPAEPINVRYAAALEFHRNKKFAEAEVAYLDLLALVPDHRGALSCLGLLYLETERNEDAIKALKLGILNYPDDYLSMNNMALALQRLGQYERAMAIFFSACSCNPEYANAFKNIGNMCMQLDDLQPAFIWYAKVLQISPDDADAQYRMGKLHLKKLELVQARRYFQCAVDQNPDNVPGRICLAQTALMQGDFSTGWHHFRWRFKEKRVRDQTYPYQFDLPLWQGQPFSDKRLFVHCEQGLGDTIQFSRFLPQVKALGGQVTFQVQTQLKPLYKNFPGIDNLVALETATTEGPRADFYVPLLDVPGLLGIRPDKGPLSFPYLSPDRNRLGQWDKSLNSNSFKVGLVWSGNPKHHNDKNRSCPLCEMIKICSHNDAQYFSLQKEICEADRAIIEHSKKIIQLGEFFHDFGDTAAAIACLDLVITVDTSVAHLAGAMGRSTWVLLPYLPDWRWMLNRSDSPWYSTIRLFRQPKKGDWQSVIDLVQKALSKELPDDKK